MKMNDRDNEQPHSGFFYFETIRRLYEDKIQKYLSKESLFASGPPQKYQYEVLEESLQILERELAEATTAYSATCERVTRLKEEHDKLKKELDERNLDEEMRARKKTDLENEYSLLINSKVSLQDEQLLEKYKLRYKAVRNITEVRFSFDRYNGDVLEGFVFNKIKNRVKRFSLNLSKLNEEQVQERILAIMEEVSGTDQMD